MDPGLLNREGTAIAQRHQELLAEVEVAWLIRNARADDPQPTRRYPHVQIRPLLEKLLQAFARASAQPMGLGPRSYRDGLL